MFKDDSTLATYAHAVFGFLCFFIGSKAIETTGVQLDLIDRLAYFDYVTTLGSIALGFGGFYWIRSNSERLNYHTASIGELRKVVWPTSSDVKRMTIIVVAVVTTFGLLLAAFDTSWSTLLKLMIE